MPSVYKVLGQIVPAASTLTTLYTVPALTNTVCSSLTVCCQSIGATFRVAVRPAGEAILSKHYIVYDNYVNAGDSVFLTVGLTLSPTDVVSVFASTNTLSFSLFGSEIS